MQCSTATQMGAVQGTLGSRRALSQASTGIYLSYAGMRCAHRQAEEVGILAGGCSATGAAVGARMMLRKFRIHTWPVCPVLLEPALKGTDSQGCGCCCSSASPHIAGAAAK